MPATDLARRDWPGGRRRRAEVRVGDASGPPARQWPDAGWL